MQPQQQCKQCRNKRTYRGISGLKDAPRFNFKGDVRLWVRRFEAYADTVGWTERDQLKAMPVTLEETAGE